MASILQQIGTPLQLTALFLLLIFGVLRILVRTGKWTPSASTNRLVINRIFQTAIVALVIGILSSTFAPSFDRWINGSEIFHGAVLSTTGDPIAGATINLIPITTVPTNGVGQFDITVPHDRILKEYKLQIKAPGYETPAVMTKSAAEMKNVEIRLTPAPPELVKALEQPLFVGQYFGNPFVMVSLRVENVGTSITTINEIRGTLVSKDASFVLSPAYWTIVNTFGPFYPVMGPFPISAGAKLDLRVMMMPGMNFASLYSKVSALPEYKLQPPCVTKFNGSIDPMTADAYEISKAFADEHFAWREGEWHLKIDVVAENQARTFQHDFSLSSNDVDHLRASIALLRQCLSATTSAPLAQDGGMANFLEK
jgi:hypothetical protein